MTPTERVAALIARYEAVAKQGGTQFPCLAANWDPAKQPVAQIENAEDGALTLRLDGPIDDWFGLDVRKLIRQLDDASPTSITVAIASPGGAVDDATYLYNELRSRSRAGTPVYTEARATVASAAVTVLLAGDERRMQPGSRLMTHEVTLMAMLMGTGDEIMEQARKDVEMLNKMRAGMLSVYAQRTGKSLAACEALIKDETWMDTEEAVERGFATDIITDADPENPGDHPRNQISDEDRVKARTVLAYWRDRLQESNDD